MEVLGSSWSIILALALLSVLEAFAQHDLPVITIPPADAYIAKDKAHQLSCAHTSGTSVSWYRNGTRVLTQYDDPNSKYSLTNDGGLFLLTFLAGDVGYYYCNVSNQYGNAISRNASLQFSTLRTDFRQQPEPFYSGVVGDRVVLHCQPPKGTPEPKVRWEKDGEILDVDRDARLAIDIPPGNLVIRNIAETDTGSYVCVGRNEAGEVSSETTTLQVYEAPIITVPPIDLFVNKGGTAKFHCVVSGDPEPRVNWTMIDNLLVTTRAEVLADNSLVITNIDSTDTGEYQCEAYNEGGSVTARARLLVQTIPIFLEKPISKTVDRGSLVTFRCVASGSPQPAIFWSKARDDTMHLYPRQSKDRFSVLDDGTLQISNSRREDNGEYQCFATNAAGRNSSSASLRVEDTTDGRPPPVITEAPRNVTASLNDFVELQCSASGVPSPTIRWTHNKLPVLADTRISINRGNLRITDVMVTDGGEYTCLAISESGGASSSAFLSVIGTRNNVIETLLPSAPEKPMAPAADITDSSVKLYWGASSESDQISFYSVEKFTLSNKQGWETAIPSTTQSWAVVDNLQPGTAYIMLVRAHNSYGTSQPSPVTDYIETTGQSSNSQGWTDSEIQANMDNTEIELTRVDVLSSTAINATWKLPVLRHRRYVEGFYVRVSGATGQLEKVDTVHGSTSNYHIITDLQPFTHYSVAITPFYLIVSGRQSSQKMVVTLEDVPSGPPSSVEVQEGPRYITVSWNPPKYSHRNGHIIGYVIVCNAADQRLSRNFSVNATTMNVALDNLNRETNYTIGVAATTAVGTGAVSYMWPIYAKSLSPLGHEDNTWWKHTVIGALGGLVWVVLCILIICLCKRRRAQKKAKKQTDSEILSVPLETASNVPGLSLQYKIDQGAQMPRHAMSRQYSASHMSPDAAANIGTYPMNYNDTNMDYDQQNMDNFDEFKAFYNKGDSMSTGPYATTVILNKLPERAENIRAAAESSHATLNGGMQQGSESSTDNNCPTRTGAVSNSSGDRSSPPVLPSFADMLPPPPGYPPPNSSTAAGENATAPPRSVQQAMLGTLPRATPQCHTCHRSYHNGVGAEQGRPHIVMDPQGRIYNPTMPHMHSFSNSPYHISGGDYQTTYPSMPRPDAKVPYQPYNVCIPHGNSSDSHDYAEPQFDQQNLYEGVPPLHPSFLRQQQHRPASPHHPVRQQFAMDNGAASTRPVMVHQNSHGGPETTPPATLGGRHHSLPSSEHSHELCMSCAEQTEYEEPWSDQHWPMMFDPNHAHHLHNYQQQAAGEQDGEEERTEETPMLAAEHGSVASSAGEGSHGSNTGQSKSGSEDSKSGRQKQRRRQRANPTRSSSPYNGYSTDSSVVFIPRKPYPKSQRRKQMNTKPKPTKSLAVQVEQEEIHDRV